MLHTKWGPVTLNKMGYSHWSHSIPRFLLHELVQIWLWYVYTMLYRMLPCDLENGSLILKMVHIWWTTSKLIVRYQIRLDLVRESQSMSIAPITPDNDEGLCCKIKKKIYILFNLKIFPDIARNSTNTSEPHCHESWINVSWYESESIKLGSMIPTIKRLKAAWRIFIPISFLRWTFSSMNFLMMIQTRPPGKCLLTNITFKWFFSSMYSLVIHQFVFF